MQRIILIAILALLWALPAVAVDTTRYPQVLIDSSCTDSNDTPAAQSGGSVRPAIQATGSADGFCDHDSRIREAAITADTIFGPFFRKSGIIGVRIFIDADIVSNDTDTWNVDISMLRPHEAVYDTIGTTGAQSAEGNIIKYFGPALQVNKVGAAGDNINSFVPPTFYIRLTLGTATSWDGNLSWYQY